MFVELVLVWQQQVTWHKIYEASVNVSSLTQCEGHVKTFCVSKTSYKDVVEVSINVRVVNWLFCKN